VEFKIVDGELFDTKVEKDSNLVFELGNINAILCIFVSDDEVVVGVAADLKVQLVANT
jgi:hypothetical protein